MLARRVIILQLHEDVKRNRLPCKHIFWLGLHQYKVEKAMSLYREGAGSLGYIAERLGLNKCDLIREARMRGIEPDFAEETVYEEIGR